MKVTVNSTEVTVEDGASLAEALQQYKMDAAAGIAVAVNRRVVPRHQWSVHRLDAGAEIVVLNATAGG